LLILKNLKNISKRLRKYSTDIRTTKIPSKPCSRIPTKKDKPKGSCQSYNKKAQP
jgi:hypothetical protein